MGKGTKAVKALARGSTSHSICFCAVVSKGQKWDIDKNYQYNGIYKFWR